MFFDLYQSLVFVVVTIHAQQFPVAAVLWIIVMVMVAVMHGQLMHIFASKLTRTPTAYPGVHPERLFAIPAFSLQAIPLRFGNHAVQY